MGKIKWLVVFFIAAFSLLIFKPGTVLAADASISGVVTHASDGTPVDTIIVYVENYATGDYFYDYTDAAGAYSVSIDDSEGATAGQYVVYNYSATNEEPNVLFTRVETTVTLTEGENKTGVNMSLVRRVKMEGYVYAVGSVTPVPNAYLYMSQASWTSGYASDYAAGSGFFSVTPTPYPDYTQSSIGEYEVTVTAPGYFGTTFTVDLTADETTVTRNIYLTPGSTVSGTITDTDGAPISNASVSVVRTGGATYVDSTASDGTYTVMIAGLYEYDGTAVNNYKLTVSKDGFVSKTDSFSITTDGSTLTGHDLRLQTAGTLTGTVYEEDGTTPIENVTVTATDGLGNSYSTTTDSLGVYTMSNLRESSHYTLTFSATGFVSESVYELSVDLGETTNAEDVLLETAVTFEGTVISLTGSDPLYGATVKLFNRAKPRSNSADYSATTISDGSFIITGIAPGKYRMEISQTGFVVLKKNLVNLKNDKDGKTYKMKRAAAVSGQVTNNGKPVHNALVTVYSKNPANLGYGTAYTDADGYYRIASLKPGKYIIKVSGMEYVEKIVRKRFTQGKTTEVNLKVGSAGSVAGIVLDTETGLPLAGYTIRVRNHTVSASTDTNGYYILDGLAPGKYKLYVISTLYEKAQVQNIQVHSNKETKYVNFKLNPK